MAFEMVFMKCGTAAFDHFTPFTSTNIAAKRSSYLSGITERVYSDTINTKKIRLEKAKRDVERAKVLEAKADGFRDIVASRAMEMRQKRLKEKFDLISARAIKLEVKVKQKPKP